jgi:hypothetical protein
MSNPHPLSRRGKPNKASSARIERAVQQGRRLPHEAMFLIGEHLLAIAARYQPNHTQEDGTKVPNPEHDEGNYTRAMLAACDAFSKAAPYYAPKLAAVAFAGNVPGTEAEARVDPRQIMWETYLGMRRRGELAQKVVEAPKTEGTDSHSLRQNPQSRRTTPTGWPFDGVLDPLWKLGKDRAKEIDDHAFKIAMAYQPEI